jgi:hypothetical protein
MLDVVWRIVDFSRIGFGPVEDLWNLVVGGLVVGLGLLGVEYFIFLKGFVTLIDSLLVKSVS